MDKIKISVRYVEIPKLVRIKSEALCLDYTFSPEASEKPLSITDVIEVAQNPLFDTVSMLLTEQNDVFYNEPFAEGETIFLKGWQNAKLFTT